MLKRIRERFSLAWHEAKAVHFQIKNGIPISMVVGDSMDRALGDKKE